MKYLCHQILLKHQIVKMKYLIEFKKTWMLKDKQTQNLKHKTEGCLVSFNTHYNAQF